MAFGGFSCWDLAVGEYDMDLGRASQTSNVWFLVEPSPTFPSQDLIFARPLASKCAITDCLDVFGIHIAEFGISSQVSSTYINNVCTYRRAMPVLVPRQAKTSPLAMHPALF